MDEILLYIYKICENINGIGLLTIYDITSAICRFNKININKVYIIGGGTKRAINILNIQPKKYKIQNISLKYIDITDIKQAFTQYNYKLDTFMLNSMNGDDFETYLCNWQKSSP